MLKCQALTRKLLQIKQNTYLAFFSFFNSFVENELKKLKTFDSSCFIGKNYFKEDGSQNYLVFQSIIRYFKGNTIINVTDYILSWQSKGLSAETIKPPTTSDSYTPAISYCYAAKTRGKFTGIFLKQDKITFNRGKIVHIYIVYEFGASGSNNSDHTEKRFWDCSHPLCLGNISKGWSVDNLKKTGFNGYVYDFSVGYDDIEFDNIKDIRELMKQGIWNGMKCAGVNVD